MDMDIKQLQKVINICRKTGVLELKFEGIELKLAHTAIKTRKSRGSTSDELKDETPYTEDDTLFWSSAGLPDVQVTNAQDN